MGADFICSICPLPTISGDELKEILKKRLDSLSIRICTGLLEDYCYDYEDELKHRIDEIDETHLFELSNINEFFLKKMAEELLQEALNEVIYSGGNREVAHIILDHKWWLISGGMSWGDSPNESMRYVDILDASGILEGLNLDKVNEA